MTTRNIAKRTLKKAHKAAGNMEVGLEDIRDDVVGLARDIRDASACQASAAAEYVADYATDLRDQGADVVDKIERQIKAKPTRSVAIAFTTGLLASLLLGHHRAS